MKTASLVLLIALSAFPAFADDAAAQDRTRQTLLYGIDSQVLDAIDTIRRQQDTNFTPELAQILADQRSPDVQKAVLDLFRDTKMKDGEAARESDHYRLAGQPEQSRRLRDPVPRRHRHGRSSRAPDAACGCPGQSPSPPLQSRRWGRAAGPTRRRCW